MMNVYATAFVNGFRDYPTFIYHLTEAINDTAGAVPFYDKLSKQAKVQKQKAWIERAGNDAKKHLALFTALYQHLTGQNPSVRAKDFSFATYKEGIALALDRELSAADLYREMYLEIIVPEIRDICFKALTDAMENATKFTHIYSQL